MITVCLHREDGVLRQDVKLADLGEAAAKPNSLLWIDVEQPADDEMELLRAEFGFHPLALEDAMRQRQRSKLDSYDGFTFLVFYALLLDPAASALVTTQQLALFVGANYVVTVHEQPIPALLHVSQRWQRNLDAIEEYNSGLLLYSILDALVDDYFPVIDEVSERIEEMEVAIFDDFDQHALERIFTLKKDLLAIRRAITPERDVMNILVRRDTPFFDAATIIYMQDVYDHLLRIVDIIDTYRELLSGALDAFLSVQSNRLNQVMKTLTASSIILMSMTLVASIYGMNFIHMPELRWDLGYVWALGLMAVIGLSLSQLFRRIDWL